MKCVLEERIRFIEDDEDCPKGSIVIRVCAYKQWQEYINFSYLKDYVSQSPNSIRYCRADSLPECTVGDFNVPIKNNTQERKLSYIATTNEIIFLDESNFTSRLINKIAEQKTFKEPCAEVFIYAFLEMLIYSDSIYLQEREDRITKLENSAIAGNIENFENRLSVERKELFAFYRYYTQLIDVAQEFIENENNIYDPEKLKALDLFIDRADRLKSEADTLRENLKYVREIYQSAITNKQNNTMNFLTGITTIFLPLSFIAGWYGMNFVHMPELKLSFAYPIVFVVCIAVAFSVIRWLKKEKFFKTRKKK